MRSIRAELVRDTVATLFVQANLHLDPTLLDALERAMENETAPTAREILKDLSENARLAARDGLPICQDTGMAVVFVTLSQDVRIEGGALSDAIRDGVAEACRKGYLRASVVRDPFLRQNTGDNTPAVIHYDLVPGDLFRIAVVPKGFGSENMSALRMLKPSDGWAGVRSFVLETAAAAGANACPPMVVGVGVGGTMEKAALMAKHSLLRSAGPSNPDPDLARREAELLDAINELGVGPGGLGGHVTALACFLETYPTHIAGLPVAVNISCHASRHAEAQL